MNNAHLIAVIRRYESEFAGILSRFKESRDGIDIQPQDGPLLRQYVQEITDLLDDELGPNNHSKQIIAQYDEGISNYVRSPSYKSVENILATVRATITRLDRNSKALTQMPDDIQIRALRLLRSFEESSKESDHPVSFHELARELGMEKTEAQQAFRYLAQRGLVDTFNIPFMGRINAAGHDALRETKGSNLVVPDDSEEAAVLAAIEQLVTSGMRPYTLNVPITAQQILVRKGAGRVTSADAVGRIRSAIAVLAQRGDIEVHPEGHKDWKILRAPIESGTNMTGKEATQTSPSNIFIGHGRSPIWRELKDFITDRLNLPYDEFNAESPAGITTVDRLTGMLHDAVFAFLVLTAEDERTDGGKQARMNVIHEVGLFQGRLGFKKAIVLLEEGCDEFSNIVGLGQIRFPRGQIAAKFEEVRQVLEREGIIPKR